MSRRLVHLIDAGPWIFRAWFALPDTLTDADGFPANATRGFLDMLVRYLDEQRPTHAAVAFDEALGTCFRNELHPGYKASRPPAPPDLVRQLDTIRALCEAIGLTCLAHPRYEADDLIATLARGFADEGHRVRVVSIDKDLCQCVGPDVTLVDDVRGEQDEAAVIERMGVPPRQVTDLQGLMGDKIDDIPGVDGVGPKTATTLLQHFQDMDELYERLDALQGLPVRGARTLARKLEAQRDQAFLSRRLATLATDAPVPGDLASLARREVDAPRLDELFGRLGAGRGLRERVAALRPG